MFLLVSKLEALNASSKNSVILANPNKYHRHIQTPVLKYQRCPTNLQTHCLQQVEASLDSESRRDEKVFF